ncbi:MAG: C25 family cysteine peptidase [Bacteroidota bacterium]
MKHIVLLFCIGSLNISLFAQKNFRVISESETKVVSEFRDLNTQNFALKELASGSYIDFSQTYDVTLLEEGNPQLPSYGATFMLPAAGKSSFNIIYSDVEIIENVQVLPSKGNLKRNVDPASRPYEFGAVYTTDAFFPAQPVQLEKPFVLRSIRGQVVRVFPYQYNPVTRTLKHYKKIQVELITDLSVEGENELAANTQPRDLKSYSNLFVNPSKTLKYDAVDEGGDFLVLAPLSYQETIAPLVNWKNRKGLKTKVVTVAETGETPETIKALIENEYWENPALKYVLLVGDHQQIPAYSYGTTWDDEELFSDSYYGQLLGSDFYPELFVGRFSGTVSNVSVMVDRTIEYETSPMDGDWMTRAAVLGSGEGSGYGDEGQADWQHLRGIHDQLLDFGYSDVYEFYDGSRGQGDANGNPTPSIILPVVNSGIGLFNYTGHGDINTCITGSFGSSQINQATNNGMYPFVISVACNNGTFTYGSCISETWLKATENNTPSGAIAACGSSILMAWAPPMQTQDEVSNLIVRNDASNIKNTLGGLFYNAQMSMLEEYPDDGEEVMQTWVFFGDPSVDYRNEVTQDLAVTFDSCLTSQDVVFTSANEDVLISLSQNNAILTKGTLSGGNLTLTLSSFDITQDIQVVCSKPNYKPLFGTLVTGACSNGIEELSPKGFSLYPVPASGQLVLDFGKTVQSLSYVIYDISGKEVAAYSNVSFASKTGTLAVENFADGIYTIRINDGSGEQAYKFVIQH